MLYRHLDRCVPIDPEERKKLEELYVAYYKKFANDRDILNLVTCEQTLICSRRKPGMFAGGFLPVPRAAVMNTMAQNMMDMMNKDMGLPTGMPTGMPTAMPSMYPQQPGIYSPFQ